MPLLASLAEIRDGFIIVYGVLGIVFFLVASIATLFLFLTLRGLLRTIKDLLNDSVRPTVDSVRDAVDTFKGTTEFVGRTTVKPIVRTYGVFAGVRKGLGVLTRFKRKSDA